MPRTPPPHGEGILPGPPLAGGGANRSTWWSLATRDWSESLQSPAPSTGVRESKTSFLARKLKLLNFRLNGTRLAPQRSSNRFFATPLAKSKGFLPMIRAFTIFVAVGLCLGANARSEVIFNTLDPTPPPTVTNDGYVTMSAANSYWQSQAFTTGSSATSINQITFDMLTFGSALEIGLYGSAGSEPDLGSLIGTIYSQASGAFPGPLVAAFSALNLAAGTEYFVVAKRTSGGDLLWGYTNDLSGFDNAYTNNGGSTWTTSSSAPMRMKVEAVPEPPALVLAGIAVSAGILGIGRRRQRQSR